MCAHPWHKNTTVGLMSANPPNFVKDSNENRYGLHHFSPFSIYFNHLGWHNDSTLSTRGPSAPSHRSAPARHIAVACKERTPPPDTISNWKICYDILQVSATNLADTPTQQKENSKVQRTHPRLLAAHSLFDCWLSQPGFSLQSRLALPIKVGIKVSDLASKAKGISYLKIQCRALQCLVISMGSFLWVHNFETNQNPKYPFAVLLLQVCL